MSWLTRRCVLGAQTINFEGLGSDSIMGIIDRRVRSGSLGMMLAALCCFGFGGALLPPAALAQAADTAVAFDIPAQSLGTALNSLAVQANLQIFFEQEPVAGLQAPSL